jgi:hypothetical protein
VTAGAEANGKPRDLLREWWRRAVLVLQRPGTTFAALRDDSDEAAEARQEPVAAIVALAGVAAALLTHRARTLLNDATMSGVLIPVWLFIAGAAAALIWYWLLGLFLHAAVVGLGGRGSYRRARHLLGLAAAPLALSLLTVWPLRIAIYGRDLFRTGGDDYGAGDAVFGWICIGFLAWSALLLVIGIRAVHGWTWARAVAAAAIAAALPALLIVATALPR